ncbi:MAG: MFS transporter [Acetobacteraceae bacterium]
MTLSLPRRLSLVLGLTQTLAWATTFYLPAVIVEPVAASTGVSPTVLVGGFSWALLVAGLTSPRVGRHIEHAGGRGALAGGAVAMAVGLVLMAALPGVAGWYAGWTVTGVGMALGLYDAAFATIGRLVGQQARSAIVGVTMMAGFASTVGWPMGVGLVHLLGWRATLLAYAAIQLGVNLPLLLSLVPRAEPAPPAARPHAAGPGRSRSKVGRAERDRVETPRVGTGNNGRGPLVLLGAFLCVRAAISAIVSVQALTLLHGIGLGASGAVAVAALFGPFQVIGRLAEWGLERWLDPLATSILGAVLLPAGIAALFGGAPAFVFAAGYGMSNGILTITRGALPMHLFGAQGNATRLGQLALPQLLAQALAPTVLTPLVLAWPALDVLGAVGAAAAFALAILVATAFAIRPAPA